MNVTITNLNPEEITKLMNFVASLNIGPDRDSEIRIQPNEPLTKTEN